MKFENEERFFDWVRENCKYEFFDNSEIRKIWLQEVCLVACGGNSIYEMSKHETKSGNPECYCFDVAFGNSEELGMVVTF